MSMPSPVTVLAEITLINNLQATDPQQKTSFQITKSPIHIGRIASHNGIVNDFVIAWSSVSRSHVEISRENNGLWCIINLTIHNEVPNTLLVNGQRVLQQFLNNNDEIGLGSEVKLRFTTSPHEDVAEPDSIPTLINADSPFAAGVVAEEKKIAVSPLNSFEHPAWATVGTLTGVAGLFGLIEQSQGDTFVIRQIQLFTGIVALILCIVVLYREQAKYHSASRQKHVAPVPPVSGIQARQNVQKTFSRTLIINSILNIVLLVAFAIITTLSYHANDNGSVQELGGEVIIFALGLLIAFISFLVTVSNLMMKKVLKKRRVLWVSGEVFVLAFILVVFGAVYSNLGILFDGLVIGVECILVFIATLIIALIMRVRK